MPRKRTLRGLGDFPGTADQFYPDTGFDAGTDETGDVVYDDFGNVIGGSSTTAPSAGLIEQFKQRFQQAVTDLDTRAAQLVLRQQQMYDVAPTAQQDAADLAAWQSEMNKLIAAETTLDSARNAVAQVSSWWDGVKNMFGLSGMKRVRAHGALGLLPVAVPWGLISLITAGAAAIAVIIASSGALIDKLTLKAWNAENIRRSQNGLEPLPKPELVGSPGLFSQLGDLAKIAVWGGIVYVAAQYFKKGKS